LKNGQLEQVKNLSLKYQAPALGRWQGSPNQGSNKAGPEGIGDWNLRENPERPILRTPLNREDESGFMKKKKIQ